MIWFTLIVFIFLFGFLAFPASPVALPWPWNLLTALSLASLFHVFFTRWSPSAKAVKGTGPIEKQDPCLIVSVCLKDNREILRRLFNPKIITDSGNRYKEQIMHSEFFYEYMMKFVKENMTKSPAIKKFFSDQGNGEAPDQVDADKEKKLDEEKKWPDFDIVVGDSKNRPPFGPVWVIAIKPETHPITKWFRTKTFDALTFRDARRLDLALGEVIPARDLVKSDLKLDGTVIIGSPSCLSFADDALRNAESIWDLASFVVPFWQAYTDAKSRIKMFQRERPILKRELDNYGQSLKELTTAYYENKRKTESSVVATREEMKEKHKVELVAPTIPPLKLNVILFVLGGMIFGALLYYFTKNPDLPIDYVQLLASSIIMGFIGFMVPSLARFISERSGS